MLSLSFTSAEVGFARLRAGLYPTIQTPLNLAVFLDVPCCNPGLAVVISETALEALRIRWEAMG